MTHAEERVVLSQAGLAVVCVSLGLAAWGCAVKNGVGEMHGSLSVPGCTFTNSTPNPLPNAGSYSQSLEFFVGEPFDSTTPQFPANQLNIRMQNSSARLEFADALKFWVLDSYEVGRCIRGRTNADGTGDWDAEYCDRSPAARGPSGEGRLFIGTEGEIVTSSFVLFNSCPQALPSAAALGTCAGGSCPDMKICPGRGSWIAFSRFGTLPSDPMQAIGRDFKVNNGETIQASAFHVELCDKATVTAQANRQLPIPVPGITGTLDGSFQFDMQARYR